MKIDTKSLVYLFDGEEEFLKEEKVCKLAQDLLSEPTKDLNKTVFFAQDVDGPTIVSHARTLPFLSSKRLIVVKEVERLSPVDEDLIVSYLKNPTKTTCLVLETKKADRKGKLYQAARSYGRIISFDRLYEDQIDRWIGSRVRNFGKSISFEAREALRENIGGNLGTLSQAIEKVITYVGKKDEISAGDIEEVVGKSAKSRIFDLTDAIGRKQKARALKILHDLVGDGKNAPEVIGMLFWQLRRITRAKRLLTQGHLPRQKLASELKVHSSFLDDFIAQTRNFRMEELERGIELLLEADAKTKTGRMAQDVALELLVVRLCSQKL